MKFLKYLLLAILVLIGLFLLIGLVKPHVNYGHEIEVNKSVEEAWAVSQDESKYDQWLEGFKSIELLSGEKGQKGSTYKVIVNPGINQPDFEMIETVNDIKDQDFVDMSFDSEFMDFEQVIRFKENNGKTFIKTESQVKGKNLISRSMFAIMEMLTGSFTTQETKNIDALKKVIDSNTTDYFSTTDEKE